MNLVYFRGLNCYHACIVNVAALLGVRYRDAFATLWSETDFSYDPMHDLYLTKRMMANLEALGAKLEPLNCASKQVAEEGLCRLCPGAWIIVGMDAFHIAWNPFYQSLHSFHYFIVQKEAGERSPCFDPMYSQKEMWITPEEMSAHAFALLQLRKVPQTPLSIGAAQEAQEVVRTHPETQANLLENIRGCVRGEQKKVGLLARYVDAMINNRYLYRNYLQNSPSGLAAHPEFFNDDFFAQWTSVKNGLYKASLVSDNEHIIDEVCKKFSSLIDMEISMAEKMIAMASN
ncbi:MAG: hypothetical protein GXX99_07265 [Clostridiales bacterium]|nr:hypothetical protein [Clostridiales bacterium]